MSSVTDDLEFLRRSSLPNRNIADVLRLETNQIEGIKHERTFEHRGVMVMQVMLHKRPSGSSVYVKRSHRFVVVGQDSNKNNDLVTACCPNKFCGFYHGLDQLNGKNAKLRDDMLWTSGLNLVWRLSQKKEAQYKKPLLIEDRKNFVKKLCLAIQEDDEDGKHESWTKTQTELKKIIDSYARFTDLDNGIRINPPAGYHTGEGRLLQKNQPLLVQAPTIAQPVSSASRKRNRSVPFEVNMFYNLDFPDQQTTEDLYCALEMSVLEFKQPQKEEFARLVTLAYPWKPLRVCDFEGYRESRDRNDAFRLTDFLPFETWWRAAQCEPQKARKSPSGKKLLVPHKLKELKGYLELELRLRRRDPYCFSSEPDWFTKATSIH